MTTQHRLQDYQDSLSLEDLGTFRAAYDSARATFDSSVSLLAGKRAVERLHQRKRLAAGNIARLGEDPVRLVGRWRDGAISIVSAYIEVFEVAEIPVAVFCSRFPSTENAELMAESAVEEHYGARLLFGVWTKLDPKDDADLPAPSFDTAEVWVCRCDGYAPAVEE